jgi:glutathione S-transferase
MARYQLYYWPTVQGRGEFVRLALEAAAVPYDDVARESGGEDELMRYLDARRIDHAPFAPPYLRAGSRLIGQTANILLFIGAHHRLAPAAEAGRLWIHQLQLTIADAVAEAHDTHHPVATGLYYAQQKKEARKRARDFRSRRIPKYLGYFEALLGRAGSAPGFLGGRRLSYADLSLFQLVAGLRYAFPRAMASAPRRYRRVMRLAERVQELPRIAAYLESPRRIAFNEEGIFRHYPELDGD